MNQTTNYKLNQWQLHDRVMMQDFNADNEKLDAALGEHEDRVAALEQRAPFWGNCQIYTTTYEGDGTNSQNFGESHPNTLTFPHKPALVTIFTPEGRTQFHFFSNDMSYNLTYGNRACSVHVRWNGNTVTWYSNDVALQMNRLNYTYRVIAFCPLD